MDFWSFSPATSTAAPTPYSPPSTTSTYSPPSTYSTYTPPPTTYTSTSTPVTAPIAPSSERVWTPLDLTWTQQTCYTCEGEPNAPSAPDSTLYSVPTSASTDTNWTSSPFYYEPKPYLNPKPEPEIIMDPDWMIKPNDCIVKPGMCRP